jgi:hypothetical protein
LKFPLNQAIERNPDFGDHVHHVLLSASTWKPAPCRWFQVRHSMAAYMLAWAALKCCEDCVSFWHFWPCSKIHTVLPCRWGPAWGWTLCWFQIVETNFVLLRFLSWRTLFLPKFGARPAATASINAESASISLWRAV